MSEFREIPQPQPKEETDKPTEGKLRRFIKSFSRQRSEEPSHSSGGQGEYRRPSYKETKELKRQATEKADKMSAEDIHKFTGEELVARMDEIASPEIQSKTPLIEIPKLYYAVDAALEDLKNRNPEEFKTDVTKLSTAKNMLYCVIMNEGLSGPTRSMFSRPPDEGMSLFEKDHLIQNNMHEAFHLLKESPNIYGEKTKEIYEGIVKRLYDKKKGDKGKFAGHKLPPFPEGLSESVSQPEEKLEQEIVSAEVRNLNKLFKDKFENSEIKALGTLHEQKEMESKIEGGAYTDSFPYKSYTLKMPGGEQWRVLEKSLEGEISISISKVDITETITFDQEQSPNTSLGIQYEHADINSKINPEKLPYLMKIKKSENTRSVIDKAKEIIGSIPQSKK